MRLKKIIFVGALCLLVLAGYLVWHHATPKDLTDQYRTAVLKNGDVRQSVSANGTLNPVTLVSVGSSLSGIVKTIHADFNDVVQEGEVLLELNPVLYQAAVDQSKAEVTKAEAALTLAKANATRGVEVYQKGYLAKQDYEQLVQIEKSAVADLAVANAKLSADTTNLGFTVIRSPVAGVVVDREVDVGQTVAASFQTPTLYKIAQDLSKMQIDSSFAEADIGTIKAGQEVTFNVDAYTGRDFKGVVKQTRLNPTTQQNVVTYDVVILVDNPDGVLLPGMTAYVNIKTSERVDALLVPNAAFRFKPVKAHADLTGEGESHDAAALPVVYKLVTGKLEKVACKTGITDNKFTEILSGDLKVGDVVVVGKRDDVSSSGSGFKMRVF